MSKPEKPPIVRPQSWGNDAPIGNNKEIKTSVLADVNKQIIFNESKKSGGS